MPTVTLFDLTSKRCSKCGIQKPLVDFYFKANGRTDHRCLPCFKVYSQHYLKTHAEQNREKVRAWQRKHPERERLRLQKWRAENRGRWLELKREKEHRRRVRLAGNATVEKVEEREVFERDRWTCQLCGEAVNPELRFPHPLSASLDHKVPVSRGGPHVRENVQLSHRRCNMNKGAKL